VQALLFYWVSCLSADPRLRAHSQALHQSSRTSIFILLPALRHLLATPRPRHATLRHLLASLCPPLSPPRPRPATPRPHQRCHCPRPCNHRAHIDSPKRPFLCHHSHHPQGLRALCLGSRTMVINIAKMPLLLPARACLCHALSFPRPPWYLLLHCTALHCTALHGSQR